jgi:flagellar protein FliO/FliZ
MAGEVMNGGFMLQFLAGLGVVVLCIVGLAWLLKRAGGLQSSAHGALRVVDGVALSTRERLVLVQVGDQQVLLGVAPGRVNAVHVLDKPVQTVTEGAAETESFAARLREVIGREKLS